VLTWADPGALPSSNYWTLISGNYGMHPNNALWQDIYIGGTSTASATITLQAETGQILANHLGLSTNGYLNFGSTLGTSGYGIRDNAGTIEYKNSGGSWSTLSSLGDSVNYWQLQAGALSPFSSTLDLLVGGTSTASALLRVAGIESAAGDLVNIASYGTLTTGNLFRISDNGTDLLKVGTSKITHALPTEFTAPGDTAFSYDILLTNQTASKIESYGPLSIVAGESYESNDLTLKTYNYGNIILDNETNGLIAVFQGNGNVGIGTNSPLATLHVAGAYAGNAAVILNQLNSGDILTASASGTTRMTLANNGDLTVTGNITGTNLLTGAQGELRLYDSGSFYTGFKAPATLSGSQNYVYTLPISYGLEGQVLRSDGSGALSWVDVSDGNPTYLMLTNEQLHPKNALWHDILVGGTSTASATIALQAATGNIKALSLDLGDGNLFLSGNTIGLSTHLDLLTLTDNLLTIDGGLSIAGDFAINVDRFFVDSTTGFIGIGTNTPQAALHIAGASSTITNAIGDLTLNSISDMISFSGDNLININDVTASGSLRLGSNSYLNFGTDYNTLGYGLRDNSGVIEFKNSSGDWTAMGSSYFDLTNEQIHPGNALWLDLLIGGTSTASATIALQAATGNIKALSLDLGDGNLFLSGNTIGLSTHLDLLTLTDNLLTIDGGLSIAGDFAINVDRFFVDSTTGFIGIGTNTPQAALDIAGATATITNSIGDLTLDSASNMISFSGDNLININDVTASGSLRLGSNSYLNFGTDYNTLGYGLRDNSGVIEFKTAAVIGPPWVVVTLISLTNRSIPATPFGSIS
jgi:hypothetical protein